MIFSTYEFTLIFLPITFLGYFIINRFQYNSLAKLWLVMASLVFYAQGSPDFYPMFIFSVFGNYVIGTTLSRMEEESKVQRKIILTIGILANVALLGYYKYTDFFIENVNLIAKTEFTLQRIVLPIGISFFTFQLIAFLVDSYRGETKDYNILDYLLFITFFPQLIVGPIVHHKEMVTQFENPKNSRINYNNIALGLFIFSIGCAKKMMIADYLTTDAQSFFSGIDGKMPLFQSWFYSIEYTVSYYFDLSGYADMAIGLGYMFNIVIPQNFNSPYKADNFQEYWKRWHMTLSRFLSAYIFRSVYKRGNKYRNYYIATMVTFFVSGFWHGAGWNFIVWGIVNGALVCIAAYYTRKNIKLPYILGVMVTFLFVILTRVLFVSSSFGEAWLVYKSMFDIRVIFSTGVSTFFANIGAFVAENYQMALLLLAGLGICWFAPNTQTITKDFKLNKRTLLYAAILLGVCIANMDKVVQFLYFQF